MSALQHLQSAEGRPQPGLRLLFTRDTAFVDRLEPALKARHRS